jgi:UDP-glucuronate 4-epimerase
LDDGHSVIGLDNMNDYYDPKLKEDRLAILKKFTSFNFHKVDLCHRPALDAIFAQENIGKEDAIVHLAAQVGVRHALKNPQSYIDNNLIGFFHLIENARLTHCRHFLYASSSSVYGGNTKLPFSVHDNVDHPISLYACTKKSNELMAHVYSYTYGLPTTGLRFFTVYGPWGRPDMSYYIFTKAIITGEPLMVYNYGDMLRDFTYIDDIVEGMIGAFNYIPTPNGEWDSSKPDPGSSWLPYRIYNIGNHQSVKLLEFIQVIEDTLKLKAKLEFLPLQTGDVKSTFADIEDITQEVGFVPKTSIYQGIPKFIEWYLEYHKIER